MAFLDAQLFTTPTWMLDETILKDIDENPLQVIARLQDPVLTRMTSNHTLFKMLEAETQDGQTAYKVTDFFGDMQGMIFKELKANQAIDVYRRNLQKSYVDKLITLVKPTPAVDPTLAAALGGRRAGGGARDADKENTDVQSVAKAQLRAIAALIKTAMPGTTDSMSTYHLQDLSDRINEALNPKS